MKPSPLPWKVMTDSKTNNGRHMESEFFRPMIFDATGAGIAGKKDYEENAEFIVQACNSHAALVEALKKIADLRSDWPARDMREIARVALALAEKSAVKEG